MYKTDFKPKNLSGLVKGKKKHSIERKKHMRQP